MLGRMASGAQPLNIERTVVVGMMSLGFRSLAGRAWLTIYLTCGDRVVQYIAGFDLVEMTTLICSMLQRIILDPFLGTVDDLLAVNEVMDSALISNLRSVGRIVGAASLDVASVNFFGGLHGEEILA